MRLFLLLAGCACAAESIARTAEPEFLDRSAAAWAVQLSEENPTAMRRSAAFALGRMGLYALMKAPDLEKRLQDSDPSVRAMAAESLGNIALSLRGGGLSLWDTAGPVLNEAVAKDPDASVRGAAAFALGAFGDRAIASAPVLRNALHDDDAGVRRHAARALGRIGDAGAVSELCQRLKDADVLVRRNAVEALGVIGLPGARSATHPLLDLVKSETDGVVRRVALDKLVSLVGPGDRTAAARLYPFLDADDEDAARSAAFVLANMGGREAVPALPLLQKTLFVEDEQAQSFAAAALASMGDVAAPAVSDLARLLGESKALTVRRNAVLALGQIRSKARDALPPLVAALAPSEPHDIRMFAAEAIRNIGSPGNDDAVPDLVRIIESDADPDVRHQCAWCVAARRDHESNGISKVFAKVIEETDPATQNLRYQAAWNLANHLYAKAPDRTVDILFDLYRDRRLTTYSGTAVKVNSGGGEAAAGRAEVTALRPGEGFSIQVQAVRALGWLGPKANRPEIVKALRDALKEEDPALQRAASEALQRIRP